jgi:DNA helicase-2/ATP-dependent DNA helicase PcrA
LGGRHDLCVVGDPAQTIYSFAGASARYLLEFARRHPSTTSIELVRNYRSTPQVVELANSLMAGTDTGAVRLRAQAEAGPAAEFREHADEVAEATAVAEEVARAIKAGTPPHEMAVLVRINAQTEAFEEALAAEGVPYVIRGGERFFQRPEVRQAVTLLRGSARGGDGEGEGGVVERTRAVLAGMGWQPEAPTARGNARDRWESLQALTDLAATFEGETTDATLGGFVDDLDRRAAEQHAPVAGGVTIATLHAAKGLEWDDVYLCGLVEGTLPISYALDSPAAVEEERRLLYVGMTRARRRLLLSWALARNPGGRAGRRPSRFLNGLRPEVASDRRKQTTDARKKRQSTCRVCSRPLLTVAERKIGRHEDCPSTFDEDLFERLRTWRSETAKAESVPAYVVFTDLTLQAIAEVRPRSVEALLTISGIGRAKQEKYGAAVVALLAE